MKNREDLFTLIKAMSKSEKRYFVLDAKKSGRKGSRYLTLFEALSKMGEYEDSKLKKKFPKNLSSDKAYLYEAILRSMRDYRSKSSKAAQVKERLMDARFLYERGLYGQSTARIAEAKAMAKELEDHFTLLEINKEEQVSLFDRKAKVTLEHLESLNNERLQTLAAIDEELKYLDLYYSLLLEVHKEFNLKDEKSINELDSRLSLELLKDEPSSPQAQRGFYLCKAAYFNLVGDLGRVYENQEKVLKWWAKYSTIKEENFYRYINNVYNLVNTSLKINKYEIVFERWVGKLEAEKERMSYHNQKAIFRTLSISNLLHLLNKNDFKNAINILPDIIKGLNKFGLKKSMVLAGNIFIVYFLAKDYENCLVWSKHIIKNMKKGGREDIHRFVRLCAIIARYELGDIDGAEGEMRAMNRYLKLSNFPKGRFEDVIVNTYLKRIFNAPISEHKKEFKEFYTYLRLTKEKYGAEIILGIDELLIWVENKL